MLRRAIMSCVSLLIFTAASAEVKVGHDRFGGESYVKMEDAVGVDRLNFAVLATKKPGAPASILVVFTSASEEWKYLRCHDVHWLINGKIQHTSTSTHDGKVIEGAVIESIFQPISASFLEQLSKANNKIEYQVCHDEGELTASQQEELRDLVPKMRALP